MKKILLIALTMSYAVASPAWMVVPGSLAEHTSSAAQVFRGLCVTAEVGEAAVAGARLPVTTYTFQVQEPLKGLEAAILTFRQVGTPAGGRLDLGRLAGIPVYVPGTAYVLFLLPAHRTGLTSPAGAGEGAFVVSGEQVRRLQADHSFQAGRVSSAQRAAAPTGPGDVESMSYETLRRAVLPLGGR